MSFGVTSILLRRGARKRYSYSDHNKKPMSKTFQDSVVKKTLLSQLKSTIHQEAERSSLIGFWSHRLGYREVPQK